MQAVPPALPVPAHPSLEASHERPVRQNSHMATASFPGPPPAEISFVSADGRRNYTIHTTWKNWADAQATCAARGGRLATLAMPAEWADAAPRVLAIWQVRRLALAAACGSWPARALTGCTWAWLRAGLPLTTLPARPHLPSRQAWDRGEFRGVNAPACAAAYLIHMGVYMAWTYTSGSLLPPQGASAWGAPHREPWKARRLWR